MGHLWKKTQNDYESSAKVVDGNLILSLPDAINPIVWRMELGSIKASALEVKSGADGAFLLCLKTPKGEVHDIAPFQTRDRALRALMRVSAALQSAEGKIAPVSVVTQATPASINKSGGTVGKWILSICGVLLVMFLFAYLSSLSPQQADSVSGEQSATSITGEPNVESGVPQSADQMLRGY